MKRFIFILAALAVLACSKEPEVIPITPKEYDMAILHNGSWQANNSCITLYNSLTKALKPEAFFAANNQRLGDLGQDILVFNDKIFIAVNGSQVVFVTDFDLNIIEVVTAYAGETKLSPRYLCSSGTKVYVTYYEGYLGEIDPDSYRVRTTPVGPNPEGCTYAKDRVYVANSGGYLYPSYNNTVSVVDAVLFEEVSTFKVNTNPCHIHSNSDGSFIYISSFGDYADIPASLEVYSTTDYSVTTLSYSGVSSFTIDSEDNMYILCGGYDADWNVLPGRLFKHNASSNVPLEDFASSLTFPDAYSIAAAGGYVFVGCSDYLNTGDLYVITPDGTLYDKIDTRGLNPLTVISF